MFQSIYKDILDGRVIEIMKDSLIFDYEVEERRSAEHNGLVEAVLIS